ncbi:predicted protein [Chaetomium globosum CBS 148.51]|uniref:Uncharacterized protein n=1 Tax=Chaetomium globosum (strain ATCC 6205 / CBS 148.51 / DSM 1962 / NBRC 6347 / NRRL 1970) TaxID=306901 RepID=Q2H5T0_CHAGB|nr:uncharacterized protein CHGG_05985 [Chaetomium globosum CBS 148.51]EAQ89366.1 predicted protein [Chaetomium globosum CBS 148.51]
MPAFKVVICTIRPIAAIITFGNAIFAPQPGKLGNAVNQLHGAMRRHVAPIYARSCGFARTREYLAGGFANIVAK